MPNHFGLGGSRRRRRLNAIEFKQLWFRGFIKEFKQLRQAATKS